MDARAPRLDASRVPASPGWLLLSDKLEREHGRVVVTKHGQPAAVMLNVDDLESLADKS